MFVSCFFSFALLAFFLLLTLFLILDKTNVLPLVNVPPFLLTPLLLFFSTQPPSPSLNTTILTLVPPRCHFCSYLMLFLFLLLLDVSIAPCNATIVPPISCTFLLPLDVIVAPHNAAIVPFVSSTFLHPFNVVVAPPIPNWCFPPSCFCMHGRENKLSHATFVFLQASSSQT